MRLYEVVIGYNITIALAMVLKYFEVYIPKLFLARPKGTAMCGCNFAQRV